MPPEFHDVHGYVICHRCTRRFIPINICPATASYRCPNCQLLAHLPQPHLQEYPTFPPPTTPSETPTPPDTSSFFLIDDFNTLVDRIVSETNDEYEPRPNPASESFINNLKADQLTVSRPILKQLPVNAGSCAICSEKFKLLEKFNKLPCRHYFHTDCIIPWLNQKNNCPLCRHEFPSTEDQTTAPTSGSFSPTPSASESQPIPSLRVRRTARMQTLFFHRILAER